MMRSQPPPGPPPVIMPADGPDAALFESAVLRAITAVNADGGMIATLDDSRSMMIMRVRQMHPRLQPPLPRGPRSRPLPPSEIDGAITTLMPSMQVWRNYRQGERLVGTVWQNGEPVILSGDEVRGLPSASAPEDPTAAWHLAVPIFAVSGARQAMIEDPPVIGVLAVYVYDVSWRFSQQHIHLLQAHAQNIAMSLTLAQVSRQERRHNRLIQLLQELTSDIPSHFDAETFYGTFGERIAVAIGGVLDCYAFTLVMPAPATQGDTMLALHSILENGMRFAPMPLTDVQAPWWAWVRKGQTIAWTSESDRHQYAELRQRPWGTQEYMDSQIIVPIKAPSGVVGALWLASPRVNAYSREQVSLLEMAGRVIGMAIEHAQMRTQRRSSAGAESERALALLNNALLGLNATLDVSAIIHDLVEQASELMHGQVCAYLEYLPQTDELVMRDIAQNKDHPYEELIGQRLPVGDARRRQAVEGQPVVLEDLAPEYQRGDQVGALLKQYHVRAMVLAPIIHKDAASHHDRVVGILAIHAPEQQALFSPSEVMNLMALGHVAASALNNARTFAQLRELDRLKDEFILTASHEFRTPMSAIQGFSWLLHRRGETMTPDQARHWASEVMRATEQLKDMMDTITESWRTKSVQLPQLEPVQVSSVVQNALEVSSGLIASDHPVDAQVSEDLWVQSEADRLRHVISNLLINAAKYSQAGTPIRLTAMVRQVADLLAISRERGARDGEDGEDALVTNVTANSGPWVVVSVHDQGIGISAINQKRLFAKFVRLELKTPVRGTGLGLYICRRYIEAMGGEIWVESAPGSGSTFSFCLPQVRPATS